MNIIKSIISSANGHTITNFSGGNITINGGKIIVNGVDITDSFGDQKQINITIEGDVDELNVDNGAVTITGSVSGSVSTQSGSIRAGGDIGGDASSMSGAVRCH